MRKFSSVIFLFTQTLIYIGLYPQSLFASPSKLDPRELCSNANVNSGCILKSQNFTSDYTFTIPSMNNETTYSIIGNSTILNCTYPCTKIWFDNA
jgi:hypothetical protein